MAEDRYEAFVTRFDNKKEAETTLLNPDRKEKKMVHKWDTKPVARDHKHNDPEHTINHPVVQAADDAAAMYGDTTPESRGQNAPLQLTGTQRAQRDAQTRIEGRKFSDAVKAKREQDDALNAMYPTTPKGNRAPRQKTWRTVQQTKNGPVKGR